MCIRSEPNEKEENCFTLGEQGFGEDDLKVSSDMYQTFSKKILLNISSSLTPEYKRQSKQLGESNQIFISKITL